MCYHSVVLKFASPNDMRAWLFACSANDTMIVNNTGANCTGLPVRLPLYALMVVVGLTRLAVCLRKTNIDVLVPKIGIWSHLKGLLRVHVGKLRHGWIDADHGQLASLVPLILASGALDAFIVCDFTEVRSIGPS